MSGSDAKSTGRISLSTVIAPTMDTTTKEGRDKRMMEIVDGYMKSGNKVALVNLIGGSVEDFSQKTGFDYADAPRGYNE